MDFCFISPQEGRSSLNILRWWSQYSNKRKHSVRNFALVRVLLWFKLDCVAQERVGDVVGVVHAGEGEVVGVALVVEGVGVDKDGLARLVGLQPGAACS